MNDFEERIEKMQRRHRREMNTAARASDEADLFFDQPPEELLVDYPIDWDDPNLVCKAQGKYQVRRRNIKRSWNRIQLFAPELLAPNAEPQRVFEMSTAHAGMLEVCRYNGHEVLGNDYLSFVKGSGKNSVLYRSVDDPTLDRETDDLGFKRPTGNSELDDWVYKPIIDAVKVPIVLFDGGVLPYPLEDKSHDYLFCFQAIEHYTNPDDWLRIVGEFCRITTKKIVLLLNWNLHHTRKIEGYEDSYHKARLALRNYDENGFRCTSVHMHRNRPAGFVLSARVAG